MTIIRFDQLFPERINIYNGLLGYELPKINGGYDYWFIKLDVRSLSMKLLKK